MQPIVQRRHVGSLWSIIWLMFGAATGTGCARPVLTMEREGRVRLTEETLHLVEGTYRYESSEDQCPTCSFGLFDEVLGTISRGESDVPSDSASVATVRVVDGRRLLITSYLDGREVERRTLHGRINPAGYFEAATTDLRSGSFFLAWDLDRLRAGVGVTDKGQLIVIDETAGFSGIGPVFLGGSGGGYYLFDRLDPNAEHYEEAVGEEAVRSVPVGDPDGEDP